MVKSYLRYVLQDSFGTVTSKYCRSILPLSQDIVVTGHDDVVSVWNCRTGESKIHLQPKADDYYCPSNVTCFIYSSVEEGCLFVGYGDGSTRRFQLRRPFSVETTLTINEDFILHGHKSAVSCFALNPSHRLLASGSQDSSIILWNTDGDLGLFKLEGHRNEVTDLRFVSHSTASEGQLKSRKLTHEGYPVSSDSDILGFLISVSKDCIIRIWDLTSQLCIQTVIHSTAELYGLAINADETRLYVCGSENRIRCYKLDMTGKDKDADSTYDIPVYAKELPSVNRPEAHGRCRNLCIMYSDSDAPNNENIANPSPDTPEIQHRGLMLCVTNHFVVFYRLYDSKEAAKRQKRRQKRIIEKQKARCNKLREALKAAGRTVTIEFDSIESEILHMENILSGIPTVQAEESLMQSDLKPQDLAASDEVNYMFVVNATERVISFECLVTGFAIGHANNTVSIWRVNLRKLLSQKVVDDGDMENLSSLCERVQQLDSVGHPDPIIGLSVSHDDMMVMSFSSESIRVWNSMSHNCIRIVECKIVTCAYFIAGNRHVLVGTANGDLKVLYLDKCEVQDVFSASPSSKKLSSDTAVVCMTEHPEHSSFAAAFQDRQVRIFEYALKKKGSEELLRLKELSATSIADEPTDIKYSPDGKLLAVSLHNNTIQTFYVDSMKPFLSLYGHQLPVTSIDISSDGTLLASSSLDKSVKIWGLDFGNIHRSLLGYSSAILKCRWIHETHYLITVGLDSTIRLWDCDTYKLICQLRGHSTAVRSIALSSDTHFFVTASDDSTIRLWKRSEEQIFLSEEREKELEIQLEHEAVRGDIKHPIPVEQDTLVNKATRKTIESVKAAEQLMQIIDEAEGYRVALEDYAKRKKELAEAHSGDNALSRYGPADMGTIKEPEAPLELFNRTPTEHVMMAVSSLTHGIIHEVLIALPFIYAEKLMHYTVCTLEAYQERCRQGQENLHSLEMACKTALLLVQIYFRQFYAPGHQRPLVARLGKALPWLLKYEQERLQRNKAALDHMKTMLDADSVSKRLRDA